MTAVPHQPVMVAEVVGALQPRPEGRYVDGTVGAGGHAAAILEASKPTGWLLGCDRDAAALVLAARRLSVYEGRFELRHSDYAAMGEWLPVGSCDGILLDLGVSAMQLEQSERGFSFQRDGPLDMRMDPDQDVKAADIVNHYSEEELARIFWEFGGERRARRQARAVVRARAAGPLVSTGQLAGVVERACGGKRTRIHPATRIFQALRIEVNREWESLERGLAAALGLLKPGGRLAIITFHSGEDRIVKRFGRRWSQAYETIGERDIPELRRERPRQMQWVRRKAWQPSAAEVAENPRSRSAQLRVLERI